MSVLEARYRRLIGFFPAAHRREYGEEMVGVLMNEARLGQRFPGWRDALDLVRAGVTARLDGRARSGRDASAVAALVTALVLALLPIRWAALEGSWQVGLLRVLSLDMMVRSGGWFLVALAVVLGWRHVAAALAVTAGAMEVAVLAYQSGTGWRWIGMGWVLAAIPFVLILTWAAAGRRPSEVLGRRGVLLVAGGIVLGMLSVAPDYLRGRGIAGSPNWAVLAAGVVLMAAGLWRAGAAVRRVLTALLAGFAAIAAAQVAFEQALDVQQRFTITPGLVVAEVAFLLGFPLLAAALVAAVSRASVPGWLGVALRR